MVNQYQVGVAHTEASVLATNKVLRNTYLLLSMTLLFSALTAWLSMSMNMPYPGPIITLVGYFGLLFVTNKFRTSAFGLNVILFCEFQQLMNLSLMPILAGECILYKHGAIGAKSALAVFAEPDCG